MDRQDHRLLLDIKGFTWGYPDQAEPLFSHFDFALYQGDFVIVMGKSGVGKSTLVKFITGAMSLPPKVFYHLNEDMSRMSAWELQNYKRKIGVVLQEGGLIPWMTVQENVIFPLQIAEIGPSLIDMKFQQIARQLGLEDIAHKKVEHLSGGYKQKVAIARALVHNPEFLVADEPTGNLDREDTKKIADTFIQLNQAGNTVLFVSHDVHLIDYIKYKLPGATIRQLGE